MAAFVLQIHNCYMSFLLIIKLTDVSVHSFIADTISTETGTTGSGTVEIKIYYELGYFTEFYLFQAWTWQLTMF